MSSQQQQAMMQTSITLPSMDLSEVKTSIEKQCTCMESINYDVIGKDIPRLVKNITVNHQSMTNVAHFLISIINLTLNRGNLNYHLYFNNLYNQLQDLVESEDLLSDPTFLITYLKNTLLVSNPVFYLLRCCNQTSISSIITYFKLKNPTLPFQDCNWLIHWKILDLDKNGIHRTIFVNHERIEKCSIHGNTLFIFKWNIQFEYEQYVTNIEELNRSLISNLDMIKNRNYTNIHLRRLKCNFIEIMEYNSEVLLNSHLNYPIAFQSKESTLEWLKNIYQPIEIQF
ncbi:hypothetical protein ABK040_010513 [Willaertia magna]